MHNSIDHKDAQTQGCIERLRLLPTETVPPFNWQEFRRRAQQRSVAANDATAWRPIGAAAALLLFVCAIAVWGRLSGVGGGRHLVTDSGAIEEVAPTGTGSPVQSANSERLRRAKSTEFGATPGEGAEVRGVPRTVASGEGAPGTVVASEVGAPSAVVPSVVGMPGTTSTGEISSAGETSNAANRTRAIELWLATLPREPAVVRVGTRAAVAGLEDRIAQVDDLMTSIRIDGVRPDRVAALQRERLRLVGSLAQVRYAEVVASESP